jgi:ketosteroid isomerase-like protein
MTDFEARIARLEAESDIRKLKARYLNACDAKDVEAIRACFTPDASIDYAPMGEFSVDGLIDIFTAIAVGSPIIDVHQMHNGEIEVQDADHASARWSLGFTTYDPRTRKFRVMSGFYHDEYTHTPDGWLVSKTQHTPRLILDGELAESGLRAEVLPT